MLSVKKWIAHVSSWLKGEVYIDTVNSLRVRGATGKDVGLRATSSDSTGDVAVQVGSGGINHGVYSHTLDKWMLVSDGADVYADGANLTVNSQTLSWLNGTSGSELRVSRWGKVVTVSIWNPTKLAVGDNIVGLLPVGFRPTNSAVLPLVGPTSDTSTNKTGLSLRATIEPNGNIKIYNYRGSAINGTTNQTGTITYVVGGVVRRLLNSLISERRWVVC